MTVEPKEFCRLLEVDIVALRCLNVSYLTSLPQWTRQCIFSLISKDLRMIITCGREIGFLVGMICCSLNIFLQLFILRIDLPLQFDSADLSWRVHAKYLLVAVLEYGGSDPSRGHYSVYLKVHE